MHDYYCKICNNIIGEWNNKHKWYMINDYCNFTRSKNNYPIYFLDCKKCNKFVGLECWRVCETCFGKNQIFGEKKLFNWFLKYKKLQLKYINYKFICKICNNDTDTFRWQHWFFEELTFYK